MATTNPTPTLPPTLTQKLIALLVFCLVIFGVEFFRNPGFMSCGGQSYVVR